MIHRTQVNKTVMSLLALALFISGCTKTRDAALPDDAQESVFAISEFGDVQTDQTPYKISTEERTSALSVGEASKATAEKGMAVAGEVNVPDRLKFMFKGLEMSGQAGATYPITLSVDRQFVTAYKVVTDFNQLTVLEKQLAQATDEVQLQKQIQRTKDNSKVKSLIANLKQARSKKVQTLSSNSGALLVPLFKFKVKGYGILQRTKNELKEETSTLRIKTTDWTEATHIVMDVNASERMPIGIDPNTRGDLDRTFVMNSVNNKVMTAGMLKEEFQLPLNLKDDTQVLTLLDVDALHVFEIGNKSKLGLTDSQLQQLALGSNQSNVRQCPADLVKILPEDKKTDCVMILRFDFPVAYVKPQLPVVDYEGNQDSKITFEEVTAGKNVGLVQIKKTQPKKIEDNNEMDPRTTLRVADIKGKEFFFRRTLQDAPVTTSFPPGMAGQLSIVKFDMQENRLVVLKTDKLVDFKSGSNEKDVEEVMSFPVKYFKHEARDSSGAEYSVSRMIPTSRAQAELIQIDWTANKLSSDYSPYETLNDYCIKSIADQTVSDVDMQLDKGTLNFSIDYSVGLAGYCITDYPIHNSYNGNPSYQTTARLQERVSFKLNDRSTDTAFAPKIPFRAQNEMGYGVWTIGKLKPTEDGLIGRQDQEENFPVVHDFRGGKKLLYTVTGLEPSVSLPSEIRALYREVMTEMIDAWDLAYRNAFKGTSLERSGRYVEVQFSGDAGVDAKLGDLNRNIVHFENKTNMHHGILGVSQVGFNPRSGIVVADSLIIYAGNLKSYVASTLRNHKVAEQYETMKKEFRTQALAQLQQTQKAQLEAEKAAALAKESAANPAQAVQGNVEQKAEIAKQFGREILKLTQGQPVDGKALVAGKKMNISANEVRNAVLQMRTLETRRNNLALSEKIADQKGAWLDRAIQKIQASRSHDEMEIQGIIAAEVLSSEGERLSDVTKNQLEQTRRRGLMREKLNAMFKNAPGCMLTENGDMGQLYAKKSGIEALRDALRFDIGHEMGHSQGLTHNFIGSMDKANYVNEDGSATKRNYSSIMDYFQLETFSWDGIGTYDTHALRASHLGLLEVTPEFKTALENKGEGKLLAQGKFISVNTLKEKFAKSGWNNFNKRAIRGMIKPYKYCTDIHVGYEPTCQRFDYGTSAAEIVENIAKQYEARYVTSYYAWDRNYFGVNSYFNSISYSYMQMLDMRQFLDELFYTLIVDPNNQEKISDYVQASLRAYVFYNQLIRTPDANVGFLDNSRFVAVPYSFNETDAKGQPTGKKIQDVQIVEKRALQNRMSSDDRLDTIGIEYDKVLAMNFISMKGFPEYKYYSNSIMFSFLDFEKYVLGMTSETSFFVNTISGIMLDQLQPTFSNENAMLSPVQGASAEVTALMRSRAGISAILNLEASTLRDKDNYASYFKVGSSVGASKNDRISLSNLGVSGSSESRISYWALDNAVAAQKIMDVAAEKSFFMQNSATIKSAMEKLVIAQVSDVISEGKSAEAIAKAKAELIALLTELNKDGLVISKEAMATNPNATIEKLVEGIIQMNAQVFQIALTAILKPSMEVSNASVELKSESEDLAKLSAIYALQQGALLTGFEKIGQEYSKYKGLEFLSKLKEETEKLVVGDSNLEFSYGIIIKNLEFLNILTNITNPEYAR